MIEHVRYEVQMMYIGYLFYTQRLKLQALVISTDELADKQEAISLSINKLTLEVYWLHVFNVMSHYTQRKGVDKRYDAIKVKIKDQILTLSDKRTVVQEDKLQPEDATYIFETYFYKWLKASEENV